MYKWSVSRFFKKTESLPRSALEAVATPSYRKAAFLGTLLLAPLLLSGCIDRSANGRFSHAVQLVIPESKIVDYRTAQCDTLWDIEDKEVLENSLYWLRAMDCAERLSTAQSRALAKSMQTLSWSTAFKQGILIGSADPSMAERRQIVERLNSYSQTFPGSLRPLIQLWREQQVLRIALSEERARYQRLQDESDSQIDRLRESQVRLQYHLQDTTRKLENLTDIERQLSSRKQLQNEISEPEAEIKAAAGSNPEPAKADEMKEEKAAEKKSVEARSIETKSIETKPVETKPTETKPAAEKSAKPVEPAAQPTTPVTAPEAKPAETYSPPATQPSPASKKESEPHDTTQTGQSTAG